MVDLIRFPDFLGEVIARLKADTGAPAGVNLPSTFTRFLRVGCTVLPQSMVQRRTTLIVEAYDSSDAKAGTLASDADAFLEAWCRTEDDGPYDYTSDLAFAVPDPDSGKNRSVLTCQMTWDRI